MAVTWASQLLDKNLKILLTNSLVVKVFPSDFNSLVMWVNHVYISMIVSWSLILNNAYVLMSNSILDCFTWLVPSCATCKASQMSLADSYSEILVYSSGPRPKYKSFWLLHFSPSSWNHCYQILQAASSLWCRLLWSSREWVVHSLWASITHSLQLECSSPSCSSTRHSVGH